MSDREFSPDCGIREMLSSGRVRELLLTRVASYPLSYHFMNYFLTYGLSMQYNHSSSEQAATARTLTPTAFLKRLFFYARTLVHRGGVPEGNLDVVLVSRYRFTDTRIAGKTAKSEYLFGELIGRLDERDTSIRTALVLADFVPPSKLRDCRSYSLIQYITPWMLLKAGVFGFVVHLKWKVYGRKAVRCGEPGKNCEHVRSLLDGFFTFRGLCYHAILDYGLHSMLTKHDPVVVVANDDVMALKPENPRTRRFIIVQSASINDAKEKCKKVFIQVFSSLAHLRADCFIVSGSRFRDTKMDTGDAREGIVTGQPRYDILHRATRVYSRGEFVDRYGINPDSKIVLWTTQCHSMSDEENEANLRAVIGAMQSIRDATLVIKQHPAEADRYTGMISQHISRSRIEAILTAKDSDTYEQLVVCDLMITKHSTTAMEAVALEKPVIILNTSPDPNPVDYVAQGVAVGVNTAHDLEVTIRDLLRDDSELRENRPRFIEERFHSIDGNATERVIRVIVNMLAEARTVEGGV